jgi:hypothetical protein
MSCLCRSDVVPLLSCTCMLMPYMTRPIIRSEATLYTHWFVDSQLFEIPMRLSADISALLALLCTPTYTPNTYPCIVCDSVSSCTTFKHARIQKTLIFEAYTAYMYTRARIDFLSLWQFSPRSMCPCLIRLSFLIHTRLLQPLIFLRNRDFCFSIDAMLFLLFLTRETFPLLPRE